MKTVIIFSHAYQEQSVANKAIIEILAQQPDTEIRNLEQLYPDGHIDVAAEQAALEGADIIVAQHPVFWFNLPPMLKKWQDEVWTYGWAYGTGGDKLQGKKFIHSFTTGSGADVYQGAMYETLVAPLRTSATFVGMDYKGEVAGFKLLSLSNPNAAEDARGYAQQLIAAIEAAKQ